MESTPTADRDAFQTTHWTTVLEASRAQTEVSQDAFARLYLQYWYPLYAYTRRRGLSPHEAEDITQDFFALLIRKQSLSGLQREGGKFRSFLLKSLEHLLANEWRRGQTQKRGSGQRPLSLDVESAEALFALEPSDGQTPDALFDRRWAFAVLEQVRERLREDYRIAGKSDQFERLRPYLLGERAAPAYGVLAPKLGMTENALKVAVHRLRQRYGELLRQEILRTVSNANEVNDELRHLIGIVGS